MSTPTPPPSTPPQAAPPLARLIGAHMHCTPGKRGAADEMTCGHRYPDTAGGYLAFRTAHLTEVLTAAGITLGQPGTHPTTPAALAAGDRRED